MSNPSGNDVLMGSGESVPSMKFDEPGDTITGRITAPPVPYQVREFDKNNPGAGPLKFYPSGDPIMAVYVDIATDLRDPSIKDDDGVRRVYLEGRYVKADVAAAVRTAGAQGLEVGGVLTLAFTHREDPADKRSRKFWQASYVPAGNAALMGAAQQSQAPAAQQSQAPAAQQAAPPAPAQQAAPPAPAQQTPPPATAPTAENPAVKAKGMSAVGMTPDQIAGVMGLDVGVVQYLLAS